MAGLGVSEAKTSGLDIPNKVIMAEIIDTNGAKLTPKYENSEILRSILKYLKLTSMGEVQEDYIPSIEDIAGAIQASNEHEKDWKNKR